MTLHVHNAATIEYGEAAVWYEEKSPGLGADFLDEMNRAFDEIEETSDPTHG
jgi:hypothetical protein